MTLKVLSVIGTRPEAIKMLPVVEELRKHPGRIESLVCVTAQHRHMLDQVLELFRIQPDFDLNLMQPNQSLAQLTAAMIPALDQVVRDTKPDWILAQGDTTTVLVAALVAYYDLVRFGHVEAGLRTGDRYRPFPEEMNRRLGDTLSDLLFAPTKSCRQALLQEGHSKEQILVTGNTVVDALLKVRLLPYDWKSGPLADLPHYKRFVLITAHRRESFQGPLREICSALRDLAEKFRFEDYHFVYPVHPNPNVQQPVREILTGLANLSLIEPLDYLSQVNLMKRSVLILTDSGGIQEEAPTLHVPVLVMRDRTERPEGVEAGLAKLVGTNRERIVDEASRLLSSPTFRAAMVGGANPYGDGRAAERIVAALLDHRA
jgi:UDP-N-acetylglucosamine 2-epimerase